MKVLFITPPFHAGVVEVDGRWVPLYFVYLAGALKATGHEAHIYDAMTKFVGYDAIEAKIRSEMDDAIAYAEAGHWEAVEDLCKDVTTPRSQPVKEAAA